MTDRNNYRGRRPRLRRGVTTLMVILTLVLVMSMIAVMLRQIQSSYRHRRQLEQKTQALLLADSAIERAIFRARANADYTSEVWKIPGEVFDSRHAASVSIEVNRAVQPPEVTVSASYPAEGKLRSQVRRQVRVELP